MVRSWLWAVQGAREHRRISADSGERKRKDATGQVEGSLLSLEVKETETWGVVRAGLGRVRAGLESSRFLGVRVPGSRHCGCKAEVELWSPGREVVVLTQQAWECALVQNQVFANGNK